MMVENGGMRWNAVENGGMRWIVRPCLVFLPATLLVNVLIAVEDGGMRWNALEYGGMRWNAVDSGCLICITIDDLSLFVLAGKISQSASRYANLRHSVPCFLDF